MQFVFSIVEQATRPPALPVDTSKLSMGSTTVAESQSIGSTALSESQPTVQASTVVSGSQSVGPTSDLVSESGDILVDGDVDML